MRLCLNLRFSVNTIRNTNNLYIQLYLMMTITTASEECTIEIALLSQTLDLIEEPEI
jgi:hypothetical protein